MCSSDLLKSFVSIDVILLLKTVVIVWILSGINLNSKPNLSTKAYFLEVSSPGVERVLKKDKHLEANIGTEVNVKLFKKDDLGKKEYKGILKNFDKEKITIETEGKNIDIERKNISQIKTVYNW